MRSRGDDYVRDCQRASGDTLPQSVPGGPQPLPVPSEPNGRQWFDLGLVCFGEGRKPALATRYGYTWDYDKGRTPMATGPSYQRRTSMRR